MIDDINIQKVFYFLQNDFLLESSIDANFYMCNRLIKNMIKIKFYRLFIDY